ncbi:hypothetical protein AAGV28_02635 [Flavobacterium sp. FZUC8N2.13]|uniref:Lipoprotein n=1 Tax=Flavobacterium zubiriense TaxID=3138075 RepID=A0ABV4T820_9FLAO
MKKYYFCAMLNTIRNKKGLRLFCAFMALYLLNCSVDTSDIRPSYVPEDLSFNDQESLIEIIVEKVFKFENAIPENEDTDTENNHILKKTISSAFYILPSFKINNNEEIYDSNSGNINYNETLVLIPYFEIYSPPPEI